MGGFSREITEINAAYLRLARAWLLVDRDAAVRGLGISDIQATELAGLTSQMVMRGERSTRLICQFRFSAYPILAALSGIRRSEVGATAEASQINLDSTLAGH